MNILSETWGISVMWIQRQGERVAAVAEATTPTSKQASIKYEKWTNEVGKEMSTRQDYFILLFTKLPLSHYNIFQFKFYFPSSFLSPCYK